ncbi:hypothetical protein LJC12_01220 [Odoribacter sp. OttesenSCG-928-J03]|nr:hypothetical protein [Odoribacter sp. OttesenSCG-928-J03]MDL2282949.1 hypothetical protein [Odoribacter sp. OttesenSCG-928-G04]
METKNDFLEEEKREENRYKWKKDSAGKEFQIYEIENAGLVLFAPWFPQLFSLLGILNPDKSAFIHPEAQSKAVFLLQAILKEETSASRLVLNRILAGMNPNTALSSEIELTEKDVQTVDSMRMGVLQNWPKMKNTSIEGFLQAFVRRKGILEEQEDAWVLTVEPQGVDILLDSLPWPFAVVKYRWMEKMLKVEWR